MERQRFELPRPTVILACGISGSGKTTFIRALSKVVVDSFWIDKDTINNCFLQDKHGKESLGALTSDHYHDYVKNQTYDGMLKIASVNLDLGKHPIIEGNYNKQIRGDYIESVVHKAFSDTDCSLKIIYCYASEDTIFNRIKERNATRDAEKLATAEGWAAFMREQPILPEEIDVYDHIKVNTEERVETILPKVVDYLILDVH